ncbi:MAG: helix-turn-helix domain-containing protein, partial [Chloroflexi bacterium]
MDKEYYTPKEVRALLGMTYSGLQNQINTGNLHPVIPPGRKQKLYLKQEVDTLKAQREAWERSHHVAQAAVPPTFGQASIADLREAAELADAVFGTGHPLSLHTRLACLQKNPALDYVLKQGDQIVGFFSLLPLPSQTILDLLQGRRTVSDLSARDILPSVPGQTVDLFGLALGVRPGASLKTRRTWGELLLLGARRVIVNLGHLGIIIATLSAQSETPLGCHLITHLGFTQIVSPLEGLHNFTIDVEPSGLPFLLDY